MIKIHKSESVIGVLELQRSVLQHDNFALSGRNFLETEVIFRTSSILHTELGEHPFTFKNSVVAKKHIPRH